MIKVTGYGAKHSFSRLKPFEFERQEAGQHEIEIEVQYCGVCHSDIHQVKNEWSNTVYPCVPGHEVVGRVTRTGQGVTPARGGRPGWRWLHRRRHFNLLHLPSSFLDRLKAEGLIPAALTNDRFLKLEWMRCVQRPSPSGPVNSQGAWYK